MITDDHNFELLPSEEASTGAVFGIGRDVSLDDNGFVPGSTDWAVQDTQNPQNGATNFGRDVLLGPVWNWQLHINREDEAGALETLRAFRNAWHASHIRNTPGAVIPLRYQINGETRRIYGRPRRFEAPPDNKILGGYVPVSVDFKCVDGFVYDDVMKQVTLQLGQELEDPDFDTGGGWIFPVTFPTVTLPPTRQQEQLEVGGDEPAYPIVRFNGPVTNPALSTDEWTLSLNYTIPEGTFVEIDTRPWRMTALLDGSASVAGFLGRRQRLSKIAFTPGRFEARYTGYSSSVSTCWIRWASTHSSW